MCIAFAVLALPLLGHALPEKPEEGAQRLAEILEMVDMPTVDEMENLKGGEKHGHVTAEWSSLSEDLRAYHASLMDLVRTMGAELKSEFLREFKDAGPDFRARWQKAYNKVSNSFNAIKPKEIRKTVQERLEAMEEIVGKVGDKSLKKAWKTAKDSITDEFQVVEQMVRSQISSLRKKIDKIFHRVEHHFAHKEHHPVLKCGNCGKQLTLREFLEHNHGLVIEEEDWWTDIDVENFYLGWPEWANRYGVKCPACESTNWVGVDFVSTEVEKELEKEARLDEEEVQV